MTCALDLRLAWRRTRADLQYNRVFVRTPYEVELIEENLDEWLAQLHRNIEAGYRSTSAIIVDVPKGNGAVRPGAILSLEDRTVYAAAVGALLPTIYAGLRWAQGAVDFGYQLSENTRRVKWLTDIYVCWSQFRASQLKHIDGGISHVVFTDLTGFYENVDLLTLLSDLRSLGCDEGIVQLLQTCLHRWAVIPGRGIPQGLSASDILAKVYLNPLDRAMIDAGISYIRYVDDMRVFCSDFADCKKALMFMNQVLRSRGLNLQTAKTEMMRRDDAREKIEGITPVIEAVQERYRRELTEILGDVNPYASISEIEIKVDPKDAPTDVLLEIFNKYFVDQPHQFRASLYHYILHRLGAQKNASALVYCIEQLYIRPQETQPGLDYIKAINGYEEAYPLIERFLISEDNIYDYQRYQIFRWLNSAPFAPSPGLLAIARQLTFDMARPAYLRAVCRRVLQEHGTIADIDRLERSYGEGRDDFERAQILVSLKKMEAGRRNAFYGRVAGDGLLCSRAVRLVRQGRL